MQVVRTYLMMEEQRQKSRLRPIRKWRTDLKLVRWTRSANESVLKVVCMQMPLSCFCAWQWCIVAVEAGRINRQQTVLSQRECVRRDFLQRVSLSSNAASTMFWMYTHAYFHRRSSFSPSQWLKISRETERIAQENLSSKSSRIDP